MYVNPNFKTKKALKEAAAAGTYIRAFSPGPFPCDADGVITVEGPHFPKPHTWYARVEVQDHKVVKVTS